MSDLPAELLVLKRQLDRLQRSVNLMRRNGINNDALIIPPGNFLPGVFLEFEHQEQQLKVMVEGDLHYYSIKDYDGAYIPFPKSQVIIAKKWVSGSVETVIQGFNGEVMIPSAARMVMTVKSVSAQDSQLLLMDAQQNRVKVTCSRDFLQLYPLRKEQQVLFKKIDALPQCYYVPEAYSQDKQSERLLFLRSMDSFSG